MSFEAPRDLRDPAKRARPLDARVARRARAAGHPVLAGRRARRRQPGQAGLRRDRSPRPTTGAPTTTPSTARARAAADPPDASPARCRAGPRTAPRTTSRARAPTSSRSSCRRWAATTATRSTLVDLERAQPAAVPQAPVRPPPPAGLARALPRPALRGLRGLPRRRPAQAARADGRDVAPGDAPRRRAADVPAGDAVPGRAATGARGGCARPPVDRLRPPRLHDEGGARSSSPRTQRA